MEIIHHEGWLRFVKEGDRYRVQVRRWFRWRDVTFGPFGPYMVGMTCFTIRPIAEDCFNDCLAHGEAYTRRGAK